MPDSPNRSQEKTTAIIAIGASAGGLEQIKLLLSHMPADTGAAFVVIQHLDPHHESHLAELLDHAGALVAVTIEDGMPVQADRVHILPSGQRLGMYEDGKLRLTASKQREARPTLIDHFFRDLAGTQGRRSVGIVLSGSGTDGALGLKAIRRSGGLAMVQLPDNAEFDGMPRAAAEHASPDYLLDTTDMVLPLCNHLRLNLAVREQPAQTDSGGDGIGDEALAAIFEILREHNKYDFRHHKPAMLKRRLRRRMALNGVSSTQTYLGTLQTDTEERRRLCADFLISVTDFFREPDSYNELNESVIRKLLHNRSVDNPIRVWVPGCATGEEAYSIAMLLAEAIEASGRDCEYIVFATDVDETALAAARAGMFPESIEADLSSERLRAFFDKVDEHYQIKRELRERVVFAPQSVTGDTPYSRLDLITCRNLLIYLNSETQKRLITLFHFALKDTGFLFLGSSETIGKQIDLFEPVSKTHRVYQRLATNRRYRVDFPAPHGAREAPATTYASAQRSDASHPKDAEQIARDILLAEHVPASVLVNRKLEILCSYGPIRNYLALPQGEPSLELLDMVHDEYRSHLGAVTHRAFRYDEQSHITTALSDTDEHTLLITARPLRQPQQARGLVLITFERLPKAGTTPLKDTADSDLERQLAEDLDATRSELHGTITALEESNEDLKGSNEEIMSMNEELQSTNEELETSKEELQSVNDELTTVNTELETKVAELESAHDDLNNLFSGTHVATLFLDRALRIKRFTSALSDLLNLLSSDIGRPLRDMTLKFSDPDLLTDAGKVLDDLASRETEVQADGGRWYQRCIAPYRTRDDVISGVVITFVNVTELKQSMLAARRHETRLDLATSALSGGMWEMPIDPEAPDTLPDAIYLSPRLKGLLGFSDEQLPDSLQAWTERIVPEDRTSYGDVARRGQSDTGQPVHYRIHDRDGQLRWFASYGKMISNAQDQSTRWIGIDWDITDTKTAETRTHHAQAQLQLLVDALPQMITFIAPDGTIRAANMAFCDWFDTNAEAISGRRLDTVLGAAALATIEHGINTALTGSAVSCDLHLTNHDDHVHLFQVDHVPHVVDGQVLGFYLLMNDTRARQTPQIVRERDHSHLVYIQRMATVGEMSSTLAHDLKQPLGAINNYTGALTRMLHAGKPADDTIPIAAKIADQVERTSDIVADVRHFVGGRHDGDESLNLNELLQRALSLTAGRAHKYNVDTRLSEQSPLPATQGDAVQIQQVLINLINNAIDALQDTESNQRTLWLTSETPDSAHVQIVVADSGPGIAAGKLESIFSSFQSTKLGGMGMGLAISRAIARWHDGRLWVESKPDNGATFYLSLPVTGDDTTSADD